MKTVDDLKVGDQVWWTDVNRKGLHTGAVTKVGRKLVTVGVGYGAYVFRKDTMCTNNGYSHQKLILDVELYQERQAVNRIRSAIQRAYGGSKDIRLADAKEAARLLQVDIE